MILFPIIGGKYWYVTDVWETFVAVPVTLKERGGLFNYCHKTPKLFKVVWEFAPQEIEIDGNPIKIHGHCAMYDATRYELYRTKKQAQRVAAKLNKES